MQDDNKVFEHIRPYFLFAAIMIAIPSLLGFYSGHTGKLLIATQKLEGDPFFYKTVVYVFDHSFWGAKGLIVNRPMVTKDPKKFSVNFKNARLYKGGPVAFPSLKTVALEKPRRASRWGTQPLTIVDYSLFEKRHPPDNNRAEFNVYIGYAGWTMGQLENEIKHGAWEVLDCNISKLDHPQLDIELWQYLSENNQKNICP